MARKPKAKTSGSTSVKWYGNHTTQTSLKSGNNYVHTKPRPCVSEIPPRVNNAKSKQYCNSIDSICLWKIVFLTNVIPGLL